MGTFTFRGRDMIPEGENKNADQWIGVMYSDATGVDLYNFGIDLLITLHQYSRKHINGLVHDCSNSSALAMELLQSCTISLIQYHITKYYFNYNVNSWKSAMEKKGLRVNMTKTKFLISGVGLDVLKDSGKFPCAVCRSGVGNNSIQCSRCKLWVHKRCSSLKGRLVQDTQYACPRCLGNARPIDGRPTTQVDIDGSPLEVIPTFPYLGDTLNAGGGCDSAIAGRCCAAWGKFRKLLPLLTSRHISPKSRGQVYSSCVRSAMLHGSETWGPNASEL